jgi:hypothetical protein
MSKVTTAPVAASAAPAIAIAKPIFVLASANPKKPGSRSAARFALYATNKTVTEYVAACVALGQPNARRNATADIAWDLKHGFIAHTAPAAK